jgi:hypothetical protein
MCFIREETELHSTRHEEEYTIHEYNNTLGIFTKYFIKIKRGK